MWEASNHINIRSHISVIALTQAEYDKLKEDNIDVGTIYYITDSSRMCIYNGIRLETLSSGDEEPEIRTVQCEYCNTLYTEDSFRNSKIINCKNCGAPVLFGRYINL